jgi:hypothetical protein
LSTKVLGVARDGDHRSDSGFRRHRSPPPTAAVREVIDQKRWSTVDAQIARTAAIEGEVDALRTTNRAFNAE